MDDTILNKIEYSNDPVIPNDLKDKLTEKEINEEKIIAYQNNDGLKVDDIIQNSNDTPTNLNNSLPAHYNLEDKVEEDRNETHYYLDNPSNLSQKKMLENIAANFILSNGRL
ncbi:unnamed protein product [Rhizophagus irregularis]|nr:unnamed protein product [Rhizophagus irregularis]